MAIDVTFLLTKTTVELRTLRARYVGAKRTMGKAHSTRSNTPPTDERRVNDAIRMIDQIIRNRTRIRKPLREFTGA